MPSVRIPDGANLEHKESLEGKIASKVAASFLVMRISAPTPYIQWEEKHIATSLGHHIDFKNSIPCVHLLKKMLRCLRIQESLRILSV